MFTDPMKVTYEAIEKSLPLVAVTKDAATYVTSDGTMEVVISHSSLGDSVQRHSIKLSLIAQEPPEDLFTGTFRRIANAVEFSFETDITRFNSEEELPLVRAALESLLDETMFLRLMGREM
jgi:hypothetical protein